MCPETNASSWTCLHKSPFLSVSFALSLNCFLKIVFVCLPCYVLMYANLCQAFFAEHLWILFEPLPCFSTESICILSPNIWLDRIKRSTIKFKSHIKVLGSVTLTLCILCCLHVWVSEWVCVCVCGTDKFCCGAKVICAMCICTYRHMYMHTSTHVYVCVYLLMYKAIRR